MLRIVSVVAAALLLLACGGQDTETGAAGEGVPGVSAAGADSAAKAAAAEQSQRCIDLVAEGKFRAALPVCVAALEADPKNEELRKAADRAKAEVANLEAAAADAKATASEAASTAGAEAGKQASADLDAASEGIRKQLTE